LDKANISILVLAFSFTSTPIAEKLVEKNNTGVNVKVLFEKTRIASYSQYAYLNASNISVYMDHNSYTMHEKVFVIDDKTVILGSYNPTAAANEKNDENILVIYDEEIAGLFVDEFYSLI
jgi:phosphatidylserine/phosphatidylglycerophosphate/cardiolipin synthase-like enzyme